MTTVDGAESESVKPDLFDTGIQADFARWDLNTALIIISQGRITLD